MNRAIEFLKDKRHDLEKIRDYNQSLKIESDRIHEEMHERVRNNEPIDGVLSEALRMGDPLPYDEILHRDITNLLQYVLAG